MVFDDTRNQFYADAIKAIIDKDSVVMDLGAGLGLHGFIAARAGAKKVYLVEPTGVIHVAGRLAKENGLADKIECCHAKIERLELPQPVDVIISVFTGNFLLEEDLLPSLFHARDKHLAKNGVLIPDQAKMFVQAISSEDLFNKNIGLWSGLSQGLDFSSVQAHAANSIYYDNYRDVNYSPLAPPAEILHMDFMTATTAGCNARTIIEITQDGLCHGFLGWFDARLGSNWLSTSPTAPKTHWRQVYLPLYPALPVHKGQQLAFSLQRPEYGDWSWAIETEGSRQKHSTFLSSPVQPSDLAKKSDAYKPLQNEKGRLVRQVLDQFNGNTTAGEISQSIYSSQETQFYNEADARQFIARLIDRYA